MQDELSKCDPEVAHFIQLEEIRQREGLELIASENYVSPAVLQAAGSVLTNKYAEGLPKKRYYGGCQFVDEIESLAISRVCSLFGAKFANVQPHSGSSANMGAYLAALSNFTPTPDNPKAKILGLSLNHGGHLTHGGKMNFSGKLFEGHEYFLDPLTEEIHYDQLRDIAKKIRPQLIIAGASSYPRKINFKLFKEIATEVNALFLVDMAHIAGLVAAKLHPDPFPYADIVTTTTHKTLRGPRGGVILTNDEQWIKKINSMVFPGIQGGPLEHIIAAKAVCFKQALEPSFITYQQNVLSNAKALAQSLMERGFELATKGTDNHLMLVKLLNTQLTGLQSETLLEEVHLTCNKNMIPNDPRPSNVTSGIRIGTPAITTRGLGTNECRIVGNLIADRLNNPQNETIKKQVLDQVLEICKKFPIY